MGEACPGASTVWCSLTAARHASGDDRGGWRVRHASGGGRGHGVVCDVPGSWRPKNTRAERLATHTLEDSCPHNPESQSQILHQWCAERPLLSHCQAHQECNATARPGCRRAISDVCSATRDTDPTCHLTRPRLPHCLVQNLCLSARCNLPTIKCPII